MSGSEIVQAAREFQANYQAKKPAPFVSRRKVVAGRYAVGQVLLGHAITGFGKSWEMDVPDEDACAYGLQPGERNVITVQYAYFN